MGETDEFIWIQSLKCGTCKPNYYSDQFLNQSPACVYNMFCISSSFLCLYLLPGCPDISSTALASLVTDFLLIIFSYPSQEHDLPFFHFRCFLTSCALETCPHEMIFISQPDWTVLRLCQLDANNIYLSLCMSLLSLFSVAFFLFDLSSH